MISLRGLNGEPALSAVGTTRTFRNVRYSVALGGKADISQRLLAGQALGAAVMRQSSSRLLILVTLSGSVLRVRRRIA